MEKRSDQLTCYSVCVDGTYYDIDPGTKEKLREGIVPSALKEKITSDQGSDACYDFCRQQRLIRQAREQIENGQLPAELSDLIESGEVPADILYKLTQHKLVGKAEKLYKAGLLTEETLNTVRKKYLSREILPELKRAFLTDTALYLYRHNEISADTLNGIRDGTIEGKFILVIRRFHRRLCYLIETESSHSIQEQPDEKGQFYIRNSVSDTRTEPDYILFVQHQKQCLIDALKWLSAEDLQLIRYIYFDCISMRQVAKMLGVSEGTIRYRKNQILARLKVILEKMMDLSQEAVL